MRRAIWVSILVFAFFAAGVALFTRRDPLKEEEQKLQASGFPTTWAELQRMGPQTGTDAGPFYKKLNFSPAGLSDSDFMDMHEHRRTPAERDRLAFRLEPYVGPSIQGAKCDRWILEDGKGGRTGQVSQNGRSVLCSIAEAYGRKAEIGKALSLLSLADRINVQTWQNPELALQFSALYHEHDEVLRSFQEVMQAGRGDDATLERGEDFLEALPPIPNARAGLIEECSSMYCWSHDPTLDDWHGYGREVTEKDRLLDRLWYGPQVRRSRARVIDLERTTIVSLPKDVDWASAQRSYQLAYDANVKRFGKFAFDDFMTNPVFLLNAWGEDIAARRVQLASIRIQRMKLKTGSLPKTLPYFGGDGIDPFTGKALIYRLAADGFIVYSVGQDRRDDGGTAAHGRDVVAGFPS